MSAATIAREPVGYLRPALALSVEPPPVPAWMGLRAADHCAPLTPLGLALLGLHLLSQTMDRTR